MYQYSCDSTQTVLYWYKARSLISCFLCLDWGFSISNTALERSQISWLSFWTAISEFGRAWLRKGNTTIVPQTAIVRFFHCTHGASSTANVLPIDTYGHRFMVVQLLWCKRCNNVNASLRLRMCLCRSEFMEQIPTKRGEVSVAVMDDNDVCKAHSSTKMVWFKRTWCLTCASCFVDHSAQHDSLWWQWYLCGMRYKVHRGGKRTSDTGIKAIRWNVWMYD